MDSNTGSSNVAVGGSSDVVVVADVVMDDVGGPMCGEEETLPEYAESDSDTMGTEDTTSTTVVVPAENIMSSQQVSLSDLARSLYEDKDDPHISMEERDLIMKASVNTKEYEKSRRGVESRFFDTLDKYGGDGLRQLTLYDYDGFKQERIFYIKLRGERSEEKRFVLNKCLIFIALKWRNRKPGSKTYGKHYQPSTWDTMLKYLFSIFRRKNIAYNYATDFNGEGEFHGVLSTMWAKQMEEDPDFATGVQTSTCDMNADFKLRERYRNGTFNPFSEDITKEAFDDRLKYAVYCLGRYFLCRGRSEIAFCDWKQIKFCESMVNNEKECYVEVNHAWDKSNKCKFKNTKPRSKKEMTPRIYENKKDELCPYRFMSVWRKLCPPDQSRVLCGPLTDKQIERERKKGNAYLHNPKLPIGANTVGPLSKKMAKEMGFEDWERCTGHGFRKMGITHAMTNAPTSAAPLILKASRHKNYQTSLLYQQPTDDMYHNYDRAIRGKRAATPLKKQSKKKVKTNKDAESDQSVDCEESNSSIIRYNDDVTSGASVASKGTIPPPIKDTKDSNSIVTDITTTVVPDCHETVDHITDARDTSYTSIVTPYVPTPKEIATTTEATLDSGRVSSLTGFPNDYNSIGDVMPLVSHVPPTSNSTIITPHYNMLQTPVYNTNNNLMHHVQRNIILQPPMTFVPVGTSNPITMEAKFLDEQQKHLSDKVKELELQLSYEKKTKEEIFKTLRESQSDGKNCSQQITIKTCVLL
jgi:hypothetical protein